MAEFQLKPDSRPMLPKGTGTPYLAIFNAQQAVIRDPKNNLPLGTFVTDFEYVYDEEKSDKGKIQLETDNPDLISLTELDYYQGLQLQWGWIYPDHTGVFGPVRRVIITGQSIEFTSKGVRITLEISDAATVLKNTPANHFDNTKGFIKYMEDLCKGMPIGIALIDYNQYHTVKTKVAQKVVDSNTIADKYPGGINTGAEWATGSPLQSISPLEIIQTPTTICRDAVGVKILEYNPDTEKLIINDPENFRKVYLSEDIAAGGLLIGTSRNKYAQIGDIARGLSGGPYFVDSRDNNIVIHNAKSERDVLKTYTYMGGNGELLEFSIKSSFVKNSAEVKQTTEIDPDSKDINTTLVQGVTDPNQGNEDGVDTYMIWPNYAWNPKQGSSGRVPFASPKYNMQEAKARQSATEYHVLKDYGSNPVPANNDNLSVGRTFSSVREAKGYFQHHPKVSKSEIVEYFTHWKEDWDSKASQADVKASAHTLDRIPPFKVKRKVQIRAQVNLEHMGGSMGLKNKRVTAERTEAFVHALTSGQQDLNIYKDEYYSTYTSEGSNIRNNALLMRRTFINNATALLKSVEGLRLNYIDKTGENVLVIFNTEIEIELDGVDVAANNDIKNTSGLLENEVTDSITHQVKAEASIIGDPSLETSMNIEIQNVSSKFSGLWYTKKVTHTLNRQGYLCKVEFVQRTIPLCTATVKASLPKNRYEEMLGVLKKTDKKAVSKVHNTEVMVKDHLKKHPKESYVGVYDKSKGGFIRSEAATDMDSMTYFTDDKGNTPYNKDYSGVIQDLQKRVDKLP